MLIMLLIDNVVPELSMFLLVFIDIYICHVTNIFKQIESE